MDAEIVSHALSTFSGVQSMQSHTATTLFLFLFLSFRLFGMLITFERSSILFYFSLFGQACNFICREPTEQYMLHIAKNRKTVN